MQRKTDNYDYGGGIVRGFELWGHPLVYAAAALVLLAAAARVFGQGRCLNARVQIENDTPVTLTVSYTAGASGLRGRGGEYFTVRAKLPPGARRSYLVAGTTELTVARGERVVRRIRAQLYQDNVVHVIGRRELGGEGAYVHSAPVYVRRPRRRVYVHPKPVIHHGTVIHQGRGFHRPRRHWQHPSSGVGLSVGRGPGGGVRVGGSIVLR